jgi:hypothetical protein
VKQTARLIIPVWGEAYVGRLTSVTLPAVLAPGNLPALIDMLDVELVIVTESRLFEMLRTSRSFGLAAELCPTRLVPLDDLMIDAPTDYGAVLTYALFRGFADLGPAVTETYLVFLNADFILSDGSLGHLGGLMLAGKRVIHAPSFRVTLEDTLPQLQARIDASSCTLRLAPRDMVKLALANKHRTVQARTVNQRLCHQSWMDQYYWYVDEQTLIGYQWPVALVAIRPQRTVTAPVLVWDYGFLPEAAPTAERYFIGDSDDFFMIETQSRDSGNSMIRLGWISLDDVARNLSMWTTKEQRECGKQLLTIHAGDLPENLAEVIDESKAYMAEIHRRLSPAVSHIGHPCLGPWFDGAKERMRGHQPQRRQRTAALPPPKVSRSQGLASKALQVLQAIYSATFGSPPQVGKFHPLWIDTLPISEKIRIWRNAGAQKILWVSSVDTLLHRVLDGRVTPEALLVANARELLLPKAPYDACICELTLDELSNLDQLYAEIRPLLKGGGQIVVHIVKKNNLFDGAELMLENTVFPSIDVSEIHFFGTATTGYLSRAYRRASLSFLTHPLARAVLVSAILLVLAPIVRLANARAVRRNSAIFSPRWTSLIIEFTVKRAQSPELESSRTNGAGDTRTPDVGRGNPTKPHADIANRRCI